MYNILLKDIQSEREINMVKKMHNIKYTSENEMTDKIESTAGVIFVRLPPEIKSWLDLRARIELGSISAVVRRAIAGYIASVDPTGWEAIESNIRQDVQAA